MVAVVHQIFLSSSGPAEGLPSPLKPPNPLVKLGIAMWFALTRKMWHRLCVLLPRGSVRADERFTFPSIAAVTVSMRWRRYPAAQHAADCRNRCPGWSTLLTYCDRDRNMVVVSQGSFLGLLVIAAKSHPARPLMHLTTESSAVWQECNVNHICNFKCPSSLVTNIKRYS